MEATSFHSSPTSCCLICSLLLFHFAYIQTSAVTCPLLFLDTTVAYLRLTIFIMLMFCLFFFLLLVLPVSISISSNFVSSSTRSSMSSTWILVSDHCSLVFSSSSMITAPSLLSCLIYLNFCVCFCCSSSSLTDCSNFFNIRSQLILLLMPYFFKFNFSTLQLLVLFFLHASASSCPCPAPLFVSR